jgi:hypothetical protein
METNMSEVFNHAGVESYGVTVNGAVFTWAQLQVAFIALAAATDEDGKIKGTKTKFSRYAQEHFKELATMMMMMKYDNQ